MLPNKFTGKHGDRYYYKGRRWLGPTNLIGAKPIIEIHIQDESMHGLHGLDTRYSHCGVTFSIVTRPK